MNPPTRFSGYIVIMAEIVHHEGPGYRIAQTDIPMTAIPYPAVERQDGNVNHGFFDLRDHPELADQIPEVQKSRGIGDIVRAANAKGSAIMTLGCECALSPVEPSPEGTRSWRVGSYVSVAFRDPRRNSEPGALVRLAETILSRIPPSEEHHIGFEFLVEPLKVFFEHEGQYELTLKPEGHGRTEEEAWRAFEHAAGAVATAIGTLPG